MIYYPIALFRDEGQTNYGVIIPDLPGCYPVGDTVEEAIADAKAAAAFHIEGLIAEGIDVPMPTAIDGHRQNPDFAEALLWAVAEVDESSISTKQTRFNVSWPEYLLNRVDAYAAAHHETRSGFLAKAAQAAMSR